MSNQQDIYAAGFENRPPMLNKENYVPWSSRLLHYAKSKPYGKLIYNSIMNGPYIRRMMPEPGDADREVLVNENFHEQTDDELTEKELKQLEADDQPIRTILLGLPEEIYAAKAKLLNEWEKFTSTDGESIESYYHRFSKLMNNFKRNKHFPKKIASNLKFLNNLQLEWSRHVTIVHQTKGLHTADYTQLYDFLKYNQKEVDNLRAERLAKTHDPLALMTNSNNPFNYSVSSTYMKQPLPNNNNYNPQPPFNQNYMQQPIPNPKDITDPTTAMNMALVLMAKAFKLNYSTPTNNNQRISSNPHNRQIAQPSMNLGQDSQIQMNVGNQNRLIVVSGIANQNGNGNVVAARDEGNANGNNGNQIRCYNCKGLGHLVRNCTFRPRRRDAAYLQTQFLIAQKEEAGIQLQAKEFNLMIAAADLDEIEEVNANYILMANLQQASTSEEQYTELLEPILEPHQVQQNDSNVISKVTSVEQEGGTVEQHPVIVDETRAYFESLYNNLAIKVEKINTVNRKLRETNADLTTELARYKNQEKCFEISQEKYDKPKRCYQKSVYQEQCLSKKINALHLSSEAAKFVRDFKSLEKEADESLAKHKACELEIERLLRVVVSQDIMSIVQTNSVVDTSNLQTELERTKERFENCIIKKENEYAKLWNDWYKKCEESIYDKISYNKAYNDMQQKIERLQAQLGDLWVKVRILHVKPNAFQSERQNFSKTRVPQKVDKTNDLSNPVTSNSVPTTKESKVVENDKVIAPGIFRINPFKNSREEKSVPNKPIKASVRTNPFTVSQPHVITKKVVNSDSNGFSSTGVDITTKTRRPQPRSNIKNDRVPSASESSRIKNKEVEVEEHPRNLLLSKNKKHMSSECNNVKLAIRNDKSKILCAMCKQCLITSNHDVCVLNYVNGMNSRGMVHFGNDHVAAILAFGDLQWGNILITRVYFIEGLGHNLFSVGQFYDSNLKMRLLADGKRHLRDLPVGASILR
ncbi:retrovirus-related pol polyprotein from transposon TNT 1-94 [Tanacetum coccineum]|uniref:Retrovirus-related pol polyprotein from transposon TNT 1-94 n=1 Tax=Tanacetum coccineum TaxID=301880 RepID=A0ABQ5DSW8_9ASTR